MQQQLLLNHHQEANCQLFNLSVIDLGFSFYAKMATGVKDGKKEVDDIIDVVKVALKQPALIHLSVCDMRYSMFSNNILEHDGCNDFLLLPMGTKSVQNNDN